MDASSKSRAARDVLVVDLGGLKGVLGRQIGRISDALRRWREGPAGPHIAASRATR